MTEESMAPPAPTARIVERRYMRAFILVACLFASWALAAALNDVLIRQFRKALDLTRAESSLVQLAFYIGYFCAALPAGILIRRFGYKPVMLIGLTLYAAGAFLFWPAAATQFYWFFLIALYTIAIGLAFLETSANPYVSILGSPQTASARLNLAQSFYGIGAIAGPMIGGAFIFSGVEHSHAEIAAMAPGVLAAYRTTEAAAVQLPYFLVGCVMCALALLIALTPFPKIERSLSDDPRRTAGSPFRVLRHPRLRAAILTQFCYVGGQVAIWSFFIDFSKEAMPALPERTAAFLLSGSLGMLMLGRFSGAFLQQRVRPATLLACYAVANILLCLVAAGSHGVIAVGSLWLTSFFMSIMYPTIFALGVADLGEETELGASFIVMSIVGGAVIPPLLGLLADRLGHLQITMLLPALCFAVCLLFALRSGRGEAA